MRAPVGAAVAWVVSYSIVTEAAGRTLDMAAFVPLVDSPVASAIEEIYPSFFEDVAVAVMAATRDFRKSPSRKHGSAAMFLK